MDVGGKASIDIPRLWVKDEIVGAMEESVKLGELEPLVLKGALCEGVDETLARKVTETIDDAVKDSIAEAIGDGEVETLVLEMDVI